MAGQASESGAVVPSAVRLSHLLMSCTLAKRIFGASSLQKKIARSFLNLSSVAFTPTHLYSKRMMGAAR